MFTYTTLLVGPILPKQTQTIEFPYYGIIIAELHPSCGCSDTHDDKIRGRVVVKYTAQDVPVHLIHKGGYKSEKKIVVKYYVENAEQMPANLQELTLTFTATIHNGKRE